MTVDLTTLREAFFAMEQSEALFDLQTRQGQHYWDVVRAQVSTGILCAYGAPFRDPASPLSRQRLDMPKNAVKSTLNWITIRYLARRKADYLFYTAQRTRIGAHVVDTISDPVFDLMADRSVAIETMNSESISYRRLLSGAPTRVPPPFLQRRAPMPELSEMVAELEPRVKRHFNQLVNLRDLMWEPVSVFRQYREYFRRLFQRHRPQAIVVYNNGLLKGLFAAARDHDVHSIELQHGASSIDSLFWSYPSAIPNTHPGLILPRTYLTFSDYWPTVTHYPVMDTRTIGNDALYQAPVPAETDAVLIISAYMYQADLEELAAALHTSLPGRRIYFKLHPHQYQEKQGIAARLSGCPAVSVVSDELSLTALFATCTFVIGVHSTVIPSAVQAGKRVLVFARSNYFWHRDIFGFVDVFETAEGAVSIIRGHQARKPQVRQAPVFFAPFDPAAARAALSSPSP